jgi:aminobenzoyl-glutamate transport protein
MTQPAPGSTDPSNTGSSKFSILDLIEWTGNKLPDPVTLFAIGALIVMILSWVAYTAGWEVTQELPQAVEEEVLDAEGNPVIDPETGEVKTRTVIDPETGEPVIEWRETGEVFRPTNLLSRDGIDWIFTSMVNNFRMFPPLGVVLVGMLGIGVAERTGLLAAALKAFMLGLRGFCELFTPRRWDLANKMLTPAMVFIGIMSSLATDAGYVVLPPLAAALYKSVGRSPLAGLAAVFAGVSAGFSANLLITGLEPMLAELTGIGAIVVHEGYRVNPMCNWWFMIVSTIVITFTGWFVTAVFVERRLNRRRPEDGGPDEPSDEDIAEQRLKPEETRGLWAAAAAVAATAIVTLSLILIPGAPLYTYSMPLVTDGPDEHYLTSMDEVKEWRTIIEEREEATEEAEAARERGEDVEAITIPRIRWIIAERWEPQADGALPAEAWFERPDGKIVVESGRMFWRWVDAIVPLLFFGFVIPGIAYGVASRKIKNDKDVAKLMMESMAAMAPIIVLAFVAGQFIQYFSYSGLDAMMAMSGGMWLGKAGFSPYVLVVAFILVTLLFNLFMGSMSAKYTLFAPIFIPMFMLVGISPELTQAAYRVGDSVSNIITPLNAYLIIILVFMQKYVPKGGMGTLIATMFPYTIVFTIVWTIMLLIWMWTGLPLGIDGELWYDIVPE